MLYEAWFWKQVRYYVKSKLQKVKTRRHLDMCQNSSFAWKNQLDMLSWEDGWNNATSEFLILLFENLLIHVFIFSKNNMQEIHSPSASWILFKFVNILYPWQIEVIVSFPWSLSQCELDYEKAFYSRWRHFAKYIPLCCLITFHTPSEKKCIFSFWKHFSHNKNSLYASTQVLF